MVNFIEMNTGEAAIYMLYCALNGKKLDSVFLSQYSLDDLFNFCKKHSVVALASLALDELPEKWDIARVNSIRRTVLFDTERKKIVDFFENNEIWYCMLKGVTIKDYYPGYGLREMSDNDILFDKNKKELVREFMSGIGYKYNKDIESNHDAYYKKPIFNFEMHKELFNEESGKNYLEYYKNIESRLIKEKKDSFEYCFSDEDFYIYLIVHGLKHFYFSGSGIRILVDIYLYLIKHEDIGWEYIESETKKLNIIDEERMMRNLAFKLFSNREEHLSDDEKQMLDYLLLSGTYGNHANLSANRLNQYKKECLHYKLKYVYRRIFVPEEVLKIYYPFFYRNKWARPFLAIKRVAKGLLFQTGKVKTELKVLMDEKH